MGTWKKLAYQDDVITKALLTEQGDIIYASAASTPAALAHGLATQYLKSGGAAANPSWDTPAGAGATLTIAETQVFNDTAPTTWTDLDLHATIGSQLTLVLLKVTANLTTLIAFRQNGDTAEYYHATTYPMGLAYVQPRSTIHALVLVPTDASGIIEWRASAANTVTISVKAYIK